MEYENNFDELRKRWDNAKIRTLEAIGVFIDGEAVERCPVGQYNDGRVGGRLKGSINWEREGLESVIVGSPVEYAPYVEMGTYKMTERPFLQPAIEDNGSRIQDLARELLRID